MWLDSFDSSPYRKLLRFIYLLTCILYPKSHNYNELTILIRIKFNILNLNLKR